MLDKLRNITTTSISGNNLTPSTYYPFSNKDTSIHKTYDLKAVIGLLVSYITEKKNSTRLIIFTALFALIFINL